MNLTYLLLFFSLYTLAVQASQRPNLIIILTDDQGYADVGFNGCQDIPTPHIDRIAHEGVRFTNGYVTYPVCSPSRAGMITGRYQGRFGYRRNPTLNPFDENAGLPLEEENFAEILKKVDYHTGYVGKWHLGTHPKFRPNVRGFDEFYGFVAGGHRYFAHLSYKTTKWFELAMAMTIQISASNENIVYWINFHDFHHQACETEDVSAAAA